MTDAERAEQAWIVYRDAQVRVRPRRQLRRVEFIAGYLQGVRAERDRTREHVTPMNLKLYDLLRALDENPGLADRLREVIPETVKKVVTFLESGTLPKDQT